MTRRVVVVAAVAGLAFAAVEFAPTGREAWRHATLYMGVQGELRSPYQVQGRPDSFFADFNDPEKWRVAPTKHAVSSESWAATLDAMKWEQSIESVLRFYQSDTSGVGFFSWMVFPESSRLPTLQEITFRRQTGGVLFVNRDHTVVIEIMSPSMASRIESSGGAVTESLLVTSELFNRYSERHRGSQRNAETENAQPGATDNPDDAQRLREDH